MMNGFETKELVVAQLVALEREAKGHTYNERHREEIKAQIKIFTKALKEIEAAPAAVEEKRRGEVTTVANSTTGQTYQTYVN